MDFPFSIPLEHTLPVFLGLLPLFVLLGEFADRFSHFHRRCKPCLR